MAQRLRDIGDARLQLEDDGCDTSEALPPTSARPFASARVVWSLTAAALVMAALAIARARVVPAEPRAAMRFSGVTGTAGIEAHPSFSPDGRSVAYISNRGGQWGVYVGLVTGGSSVRVTSDANLELRPRWSPDGSRLAFGRLNEKGEIDIWLVPAFGGDARRIVPIARQPAWSPDGKRIAYASRGTLWISEASGGNARAVTRPERFVGHFQPAFSHDERWLAFVRRRGEAPYAELAVVDVASGAVRMPTEDAALALSPAWSPDDRSIYFSSSRGGTLNVWKISVDSGETRAVTAGVGDDAEIDVSQDGRRLVFSTYRANVNLAEVSLTGGSGAALKWLTTNSARGEMGPRYSPDGRQIAYVSTGTGVERESVWVMDEDGGRPTRVVGDERISLMPQWSQDGRQLVYLSRVPGLMLRAELRRISVSGSVPEVLPITPGAPSWGDVGPDGRLLVRVSASAAEIVDPRTDERGPVPDVLGEPLWSPDGRSFGYVVRPEEGEHVAGLWTGTPDGKRRRLVEGWLAGMAWTSTGALLTVAPDPDLGGVLWRVSPDGRKSRVLEGLPLTLRPKVELFTFARFDVHPDGSRIVIEAFESFEADISMIENVP